MKRQRKRIISAWLLLSIFVSMMTLSSVHRHQPIADSANDCKECAHHVRHSAHFTMAYEHLDDCVLCQFLNLIYTTTATLTVAIPVCLTVRTAVTNTNPVICEVRQNDSRRAPAFIL